MSQKVLIIGNSDGIGASVTDALIARGDHVVGISRSASPLGDDGLRHEIQDVASPDYPNLLRRILQEEGPFDVCIYCVGMGSGLELPDLSNEPRVFEVNLVAMVRTVELLVPGWIKRGAGHFIGLSSIADDFYNAHAPSYSASKAAFSSYLIAMAFKLRKYGVYVTNVRFGFVDTKMAKAPRRPLLMSRETAARHVIRCLERRPIQLSVPKTMGLLVRVIRWIQSLRVWWR